MQKHVLKGFLHIAHTSSDINCFLNNFKSFYSLLVKQVFFCHQHAIFDAYTFYMHYASCSPLINSHCPYREIMQLHCRNDNNKFIARTLFNHKHQQSVNLTRGNFAGEVLRAALKALLLLFYHLNLIQSINAFYI